MDTDLIFVPEVGEKGPSQNDWRNWHGLVKRTVHLKMNIHSVSTHNHADGKLGEVL